MDSSDNFKNNLARIVALAERCSAEGQMNLNKLLEAAAYSQVRSLGYSYKPSLTADNMLAALEESLKVFGQDPLLAQLLPTLQRGRQALLAGRDGDLLVEEAPDVFVCRACGYATLQAPEHCPICGAWPGRFRKFVAFFNGDNQEPTNPLNVLHLLEENADRLQQLVGGLSEEALARKPNNTDWSIREHVEHFDNTQDMLDMRFELMLTQDNPLLIALAPYKLDNEQARPPSTRALLAIFVGKRMKTVARLQALPLKDLWRTGRHPEFGQITILRQAAYIASHEQTHLPEIEALRVQAAG